MILRTMDTNLWREIRWRVALQFLVWGTKAAPDSDAKLDLIDRHLGWINVWGEKGNASKSGGA